MNQVKTPRNIEPIEGPKGVYHKITWVEETKDGNPMTDTIFDPKILEPIQMALNTGQRVEVTKEKNDKGYWNITTACLVKPQEAAEEGPSQERPKSDDRSNTMVLAYAKDMYVADVQALAEFMKTQQPAELTTEMFQNLLKEHKAKIPSWYNTLRGLL